MSEKLNGTAEEIRRQAEAIVQAIVPQAKCEVWDYEHKIRCGLVDTDGQKKEFSLLLDGLERDLLETHARALSSRLSER